MARRRGRFARGTSGSQNLTTLIYSILREQQSTKKTAILNAFQANMNSRSYTATFAGQPVDREAVESYYIDLMNAYPEGSIERDNLRAELLDFHNKAINAEINAYGQAYKEGTNAFGQKVDLNVYLSYLRAAKSSSTNEDDKDKYNMEEFLVTFNDVHDDMKASGSGASALASFYKRELARAEGMGITKDSDSYRTIQSYLATAAKASASEGRAAAAQAAADRVSDRMSVVGNAIAASLRAAVSAGRITAQDAVAIIGDATGNGVVARFASLDLSTKQRILFEGEKAGVQLEGDAFTAETFVSYIDDTRSSLKALIASGSVDGAAKSAYRSMLGAFDAEISGPVGLMTDLEAATDSALDLVIDNEKGLGNPVVNVEAYKNHSAVIAGSGASAVAGQAMIDILNGLVPNPEDFGGKTNLWQLTSEEQGRLIEAYTGNAYIATGGIQDPQDFIETVIGDYTDAHDVATGGGFVTAIIDENGSPSVGVTDFQAENGIPFVYSVKLSSGKVVPVVGRQKYQPVLSMDGIELGKVIFDIDENGLPEKSFITTDGYKMEYDAFVRWIATNRVSLATDANGNIQAGINASDPVTSQYFKSTYIIGNDAFDRFISKDQWNGVTYGKDPAAAQRMIGQMVGEDLTTGQGKLITMGEDGNITVVDPNAVYIRYGMSAADLEAIVNTNDIGSGYNAAKLAIRNTILLNPAPVTPEQELATAEANAKTEGERLRAENAARLLAEREATGNTGFDAITAIQALLGIGAERGPYELALEKMKADAARAEAERRANEVRDQSIRPGEDPVEPEDIGYDPGTGLSPLPTTINKDPVASYFLRHAEFLNPQGTNVSGAPILSTTKIGGAPALSTRVSPISTIDFRAGKKITTTPTGPVKTNLGEKPVLL